MSEKCDVCGRDDGWHDLRTHAWQGQTQAPLLRSMLDDGSTWSVEPEAHMMSAPITVGVDYGNAVSDLCEQVQTAEAERDALRAEVERLNAMVEDMCKQDYERFLEIERLRKGKDDEQKCDRSHMVGEARPDLPKHRQAPSLAMVADTLDPRLGTPQPDGEPCEPMSARRWRWLP